MTKIRPVEQLKMIVVSACQQAPPPHRTHEPKSTQADSGYPFLLDFVNLELVKIDCVRGLKVLSLYSIFREASCHAHDDYKQDYREWTSTESRGDIAWESSRPWLMS